MSIQDKNFDPQVETLMWGGKLETKTHPKVVKNEQADREDEDNRSETSSSAEGESTTNSVAKKSVVDLTCSLLQLAQSVETKYLKKPLGKTQQSVDSKKLKILNYHYFRRR